MFIFVLVCVFFFLVFCLFLVLRYVYLDTHEHVCISLVIYVVAIHLLSLHSLVSVVYLIMLAFLPVHLLTKRLCFHLWAFYFSGPYHDTVFCSYLPSFSHTICIWWVFLSLFLFFIFIRCDCCYDWFLFFVWNVWWIIMRNRAGRRSWRTGSLVYYLSIIQLFKTILGWESGIISVKNISDPTNFLPAL